MPSKDGHHVAIVISQFGCWSLGAPPRFVQLEEAPGDLQAPSSASASNLCSQDPEELAFLKNFQ